MPKPDFIKEITKLKQPVWDEIQKYLPDKEPAEHYRMVKEYPLRQGKYVRPGLLLLSTKMHGGNPDHALLTAAAMQVSEEWLLIHDDFQDHSEERRSTMFEYRPTLNKMYNDELAVNAGDALHAIMWRILGDNAKKYSNKFGWEVFYKMYDIIMTTTEGQFKELHWIMKNRMDVSNDEYLDMVHHKASCYTICGPIQLGAIIAGKNKPKEMEKIIEWGTPFGCAFQIWDDAMNVAVPSNVQGKEMGGDILEGKRTLLVLHLLKNCRPSEKKKVLEIYNKPREEKRGCDREYIIDLMVEYGSIAHATKIARNMAYQAKKIFDKNTSHLPETPEKAIIRSGIDYVVERSR